MGGGGGADVDSRRRGVDRAPQRSDGFTLVYNTHRSHIERLVRSRVGDRTAVDDIVQETFARGFAHFHMLRSPESIGPWLRSIARNLSIDEWRDRRRESPLDVDECDLPEPGASVEQVSEVRELASLVTSTIRTLSRRDALVLTVVSQLGSGIEEVAAALGTTPGAARVALHRARCRLREALPCEAPTR